MIRDWLFLRALLWSIRTLRVAWVLQRGENPITITYGEPPDGKPPLYRVDDGPWRTMDGRAWPGGAPRNETGAA